jgi:hypothetical protein
MAGEPVSNAVRRKVLKVMTISLLLDLASTNSAQSMKQTDIRANAHSFSLL